MRPTPRNKRLIATACAALGAVALALPAAALAGPFVPEHGGSGQADDIASLYKIAFYLGIAVFLLVEGTLIWSLVKYRRRRGGPPAAQIRGNAPLELGWTVGAGVITLVLIVATFLYLDEIKDPPAGGEGELQTASINQAEPPGGRALEIGVVGQQFLWRYDYPGEEPLFSYHRLVVPEDTTVILNVTASDVIHSWWAPELGGKVDGVPGHTNQTWFKADEPGEIYAVCAEFCGENHADMRAVVDVRTVEEYEEWAEQQRAAIVQAQRRLAAQRRLRELEEGAAQPSPRDGQAGESAQH